MENNSKVKQDQSVDESSNLKSGNLSQQEDGRNKEWEDRARVNLDEVKEGTKTNIERDFEPEEDKKDQEDKGHSIY